MIKAVIFDMFETLVTLFVGRTYFSEDIAKDLGVPLEDFRREWHATEKDRTLGRLTMAEGGSRELYAARDIGMQALQYTWFHKLAFEPHIPCPLLDEFPHAEHQEEVLNYLSSFTM